MTAIIGLVSKMVIVIIIISMVEKNINLEFMADQKDFCW